MTAMNTSTSVYLPQYHFAKRGEISTWTNLFTSIPSEATRAPLRKIQKNAQRYLSNISQKSSKVRSVYRNLPPESRKTLSRNRKNENIRALLSYMRKKQQKGNSAELPSRRRRSRPKQYKLSSKRSRKSPRHDRSSL